MEKVECECGKTIRKKYIEFHLETDIHRRRINNVKKCTFCKEEKSYDQFYKHKSGLSYGCKSCVSILLAKKYETKKVKIDCECGKKIMDKWYEKHLNSNIHRRRILNIRKCSSCQEEKAYNEFYKVGSDFSYNCKKCLGKMYLLKKSEKNNIS